MEIVFAVIVGGLYAAGAYMILKRSVVKLIIGLALISHATNLLIFTAGGLVRNSPPLISDSGTITTVPVADPLPQALILTAIVISFGVLAFAFVLVYRTYQAVGTDDLDQLKRTER